MQYLKGLQVEENIVNPVTYERIWVVTTACGQRAKFKGKAKTFFFKLFK
jgi:hypothetical protein